MDTGNFEITEKQPEFRNTNRRRSRARRRHKKQLLTAVLCAAVLGSAGGFAGGSAWGLQQGLNAANAEAGSRTPSLMTGGLSAGASAAPAAEDGDAVQALTSKASGSSDAILTDTSFLLTSTASGSLDVSDIAAAALPSVVAITNKSIQEVQRYFSRFGRSGPWTTELEETESCGSGVIVAQDSSALYIVTNQHVVSGADTLTVSFADDSSYNAQICGEDASLDLAVIKVAVSDLTDATRSAISVAQVGSSDALRVGNQVVAIGNAMGYGQSVTTGIVSALNRKIATGRDSSGNVVTSAYIQTDAAINPGNSGGALLNMNGELIGINSAKVASTDIEGMGYAIPISQVWSTVTVLMGQGGWNA